MIYGIGTDIAQVSRFEKWVKNPDMIRRYFDENEYFSSGLNVEEKQIGQACRHYAARFAAKEAFSKALGTGFAGLELSDFYVVKNEEGKPSFQIGEKTKKILDTRTEKNYNIQLSISHENDYAVAFVIIETF